MKKAIFISLVLLVLIGCAHSPQLVWTKADSTEQDNQFYVDSFACEKEADSMVTGAWIWIVPYAGVFMGKANERKRDSYYDRCLQSKGYMKTEKTRKDLQSQ